MAIASSSRCSGGGDSVALLHVLARLAPRLRIELHAHGVDHGRRPEASAELDLAGELAARLGVPFTRSLLAVPEEATSRRAPETRATPRSTPWQTNSARAGWRRHTTPSDRAETLLLRLLRGCQSARPRRPAGRVRAQTATLHPLTEERDRAASRAARPRRTLSDPSNTDPAFSAHAHPQRAPATAGANGPGAARRLNLLADECSETFAPVVTDAQGRDLNLGRTQAAQIRRAQKLGQPDARIWLPGGLELQVARGGLVEWAEDETRVSGDSTQRIRHNRRYEPARNLGRRDESSPVGGAKPTKSDYLPTESNIGRIDPAVILCRHSLLLSGWPLSVSGNADTFQGVTPRRSNQWLDCLGQPSHDAPPLSDSRDISLLTSLVFSEPVGPPRLLSEATAQDAAHLGRSLVAFLAISAIFQCQRAAQKQRPFSDFIELVKAPKDKPHVESVDIRDREYSFVVKRPGAQGAPSAESRSGRS